MYSISIKVILNSHKNLSYIKQYKYDLKFELKKKKKDFNI